MTKKDEGKAPGWYVRIIETKTKKIEKEMGPHSQRTAERIDSGLSINLDHERFHSEVVEVQ